jgi:hypothetical protein
MSDQAAGLPHDRHARLDQLGSLDGVLTGEGADDHAAVVRANVREIGDAIDVDQRLGMREPEIEQRDEALAARQDLGAIPVIREQAERFVDGTRSEVLESRRLHGWLLRGSRSVVR